MSIVQTLAGAIASSGSYTPPPPTPTYELTAAANNVDEGASLTFTANTTLVPDGTTLYWACTNTWGGGSLRFVPGIMGEFIINSNTGSFSITISADDTTAGGEQRYSVFLYSTGYPDGQGSGGLTEGKVENILVNDTSLTPVAPLSLNFPEGNPYVLVSNTQSDWNLGTTYTIEFWSKQTNTSSPGAIRTVMSQGPNSGKIDLGFLFGYTLFSNGELAGIPEPTPAVWSHVAYVADGGGDTKVYYNGVFAGEIVAPGALSDGSSDLNIGRRLGIDNQGFLGKLAMIRVSTTAKYLADFNPIATYGVEADTRLMLGSDNPLTDLSYYELNGITTSASNSGTLYFSKATYPNLNTQIQVGNTVVNVDGTGAATSTTTGAVFTADPDNWGVDISPGQGFGTKNFSGAGRHPISNGGAVISGDFPTPPTYTLTPEFNNVDEGASLTFTVGGTGIANGTYYWTVNGSGDFDTVDGTVVITSNSGTFSVTPTADATTEGAETFTARLRSVSITGTILATSSSVTINDTSLTPASITITNVSVDYNTRVATVDFTSTVSQSDFASVVFEWFGGGAFDGPFNLTVNPGSNIYTSPALNITGSGNNLTTEISIATGSQACNSNTYTGSWSVVCLVEGTMITMADGSHKAVEDVGYNDLIRVWNFDLGEFSEALPVFVKREETHGEHNRFTFSDGTVLRTVGHHVFNKQAGAFTMLVRDTTPVGTITFNEQGEEVTLISKETIQEPVRFYNVWTQYHLNLFADGILTSNRFNNIYPIRDMKFVKDARALRPLEEFANIDPKYIAGLRLQEQPAHYSAEYIRDYVENKLERLDVNLVSTQ